MGDIVLVSKISFTSESNILDKVRKNLEHQEVKPAKSEASKGNQVRNWSIGLGSAAVLIGLGVLGRRGNLGEGVQKFLGGVKKKAPEVIESAEAKVNEIASEAHGLDKVVPKIDAPVKTEIPDVRYLVNEFKFMDVSGFKDNYEKVILPNGNTREIFLTADGKRVAHVIDTDSNGECVLEVKIINGEFFELKNGLEEYSFRGENLTRYAFNKDGKLYNYNGQGELTYILESDTNGKVNRIINFEKGTDNVSNIVSIEPESGKLIKQEVFKDAEAVDEALC